MIRQETEHCIWDSEGFGAATATVKTTSVRAARKVGAGGIAALVLASCASGPLAVPQISSGGRVPRDAIVARGELRMEGSAAQASSGGELWRMLGPLCMASGIQLFSESAGADYVLDVYAVEREYGRYPNVESSTSMEFYLIPLDENGKRSGLSAAWVRAIAGTGFRLGDAARAQRLLRHCLGFLRLRMSGPSEQAR